MYAGTKKRLWFGPNISDYHQADCPNDALGLYIFGQSNSSNTVRPMKKHDVSEKVFQFDWRTGKCFKFQEPLLGAMDFYSHPITPLMANFDKIYDGEVIVVPFGVPGSSIIDWSFGSLRLMTKSVFIKTSKLNLKQSLIIFIQGEKDIKEQETVMNNFKSSPHFFHIYPTQEYTALSRDEYKFLLTKVVLEALELSGSNSKFGIVKTSKCGENIIDLDIAEAQKIVSRLDNRTFLAGDLDSLDTSATYRSNGCRLNPEGAIMLSKQLEKTLLDEGIF